jgi:hypothetical protein
MVLAGAIQNPKISMMPTQRADVARGVFILNLLVARLCLAKLRQARVSICRKLEKADAKKVDKVLNKRPKKLQKKRDTA